MDLLLLPGMDGTGQLFGPLLAELPDSLTVHVASYPVDQPLTYEGVEAQLITPPRPYVVVAESFSGPLALRMAQRPESRPAAIILVASFISSPTWVPSALLSLFGPWFFRKPRSAALVRRYLIGEDASPEEVAWVRAALATVRSEVMIARLREVLRLDAAEVLKGCTLPVTYLRGTRDRLVRESTARNMSALLPSMKVVELDAPHLVLQRRPKESAAAIATAIADAMG